MYMMNFHYFLLLSLCLIGELWAAQKPSTMCIIDMESMLIETAGFLLLKSCIKYCLLLNDDVTGRRVSEPSYETQIE